MQVEIRCIPVLTELTFKRHVMSPDMGATFGWLFCIKGSVLTMNIYVFSDESGVFDKVHNEVYVFGGLILLSKDDKEITSRKYIHAENCIKPNYKKGQELKACAVSNKDKGKLYRSLNNNYKFGVVVKQNEVLPQIFLHKKSKQRYLDYVYKISVKKYFERMISEKLIVPDDVKNIYFFVDEHTTATDGRYELREGLLEEFKIGTYNWKYNKFYPPIFPRLNSLEVTYCDSKQKALVRAADIVANNIYHRAVKDKRYNYTDEHTNIIKLP